MEFSELAKWRYTTKKYDPDKKIPNEKIWELKSIIRLSPSSINGQPWKFSFISDATIKSELARVSYFNKQKINEASHLVVFSAIDNIEKFEQQIKANLPDGSVNYYNQFVKIGTEADIKSWLQHQVYLSLGFFLSACASLEIDSSPMEGIETDKYREILNLQDYLPLLAVALGYRNPEDGNQPSVRPKSRLALEHIIQSI